MTFTNIKIFKLIIKYLFKLIITYLFKLLNSMAR